MKKAFLLLCAVLLALGCALPLCGYKLTRAVLARAGVQPPGSTASLQSAESSHTQSSGNVIQSSPNDKDADVFIIQDQSTGEVQQVSRRDYVIGAVAAEMPVLWPDEALKAQAVAAHSYALYCRDHSAADNGAWLTADPARRQGYLTGTVLRSYWGTEYEANLERLSALVDEVLSQVLYFDGSPAGTSYFSISNGRTESSENVWGSALPYLVSVESPGDLAAENYEYTTIFSTAQVQQALSSGLGITADISASEQWFGAAEYTAAGYVASIPVCGQNTTGTALRRALGLRSTCFELSWQGGSLAATTKGYGHCVGMSQWGAKSMAEEGCTYREILAHYYPGTELRG